MATVTIQLSDQLYQHLEKAAQVTQRSVDSLVAQNLRDSLPPLLDDVPEAYQADIYALLGMDSAELKHTAQQTFPSTQWQQYTALLDAQRERALAEGEKQQLDHLRQMADRLSLRKGYALILLKHRGYALPPLSHPAT